MKKTEEPRKVEIGNDQQGNVSMGAAIFFEQLTNWSHPYHAGDKGSNRVDRGGSWDGHGRGVRSAIRYHYSPGGRYSDLGFRLFLGHELRKR